MRFPFFSNMFPYTKFNEINLDWIFRQLSIIRDKTVKIDEDVERAETAAQNSSDSAGQAATAATAAQTAAQSSSDSAGQAAISATAAQTAAQQAATEAAQQVAPSITQEVINGISNTYKIKQAEVRGLNVNLTRESSSPVTGIYKFSSDGTLIYPSFANACFGVVGVDYHYYDVGTGSIIIGSTPPIATGSIAVYEGNTKLRIKALHAGEIPENYNISATAYILYAETY